MESSLKKSVILSIIGAIIIMLIVVGVSYAFFSYSRTGETNNEIGTGALSFKFENGSDILLTNAFPISTAEGLALTGENNVCTFTIKGSIATGALNYTISAVEGDASSDATKTRRFNDTDIFAYITSEDVEGVSFTPNEGYESGKALGSLPAVLGTGTVTARTETSRTFTVKMWIDDSVVRIRDAADNTDTTDSIYTSDEYMSLYYSVKIKVEATA